MTYLRGSDRTYLHGQGSLANTTVTEDGDPPVVHIVGVDARVIGGVDGTVGVVDSSDIAVDVRRRHDEDEIERKRCKK